MKAWLEGKFWNETSNAWEYNTKYLQEIKVLLPEGLRDVLSLDTSRSARICIDNPKWGPNFSCESMYRVKVRAMIGKMPGWLFTSY